MQCGAACPCACARNLNDYSATTTHIHSTRPAFEVRAHIPKILVTPPFSHQKIRFTYPPPPLGFFCVFGVGWGGFGIFRVFFWAKFRGFFGGRLVHFGRGYIWGGLLVIFQGCFQYILGGFLVHSGVGWGHHGHIGRGGLVHFAAWGGVLVHSGRLGFFGAHCWGFVLFCCCCMCVVGCDTLWWGFYHICRAARIAMVTQPLRPQR